MDGKGTFRVNLGGVGIGKVELHPGFRNSITAPVSRFVARILGEGGKGPDSLAEAWHGGKQVVEGAMEQELRNDPLPSHPIRAEGEIPLGI